MKDKRNKGEYGKQKEGFELLSFFTPAISWHMPTSQQRSGNTRCDVSGITNRIVIKRIELSASTSRFLQSARLRVCANVSLRSCEHVQTLAKAKELEQEQGRYGT